MTGCIKHIAVSTPCTSALENPKWKVKETPLKYVKLSTLDKA